MLGRPAKPIGELHASIGNGDLLFDCFEKVANLTGLRPALRHLREVVLERSAILSTSFLLFVSLSLSLLFEAAPLRLDLLNAAPLILCDARLLLAFPLDAPPVGLSFHCNDDAADMSLDQCLAIRPATAPRLKPAHG